MGMTMKRNAKAEHVAKLTDRMPDGYLRETFASPTLYRAAVAERGHGRMTPAEYAARRMGRGPMDASRLETRIELRQQLRRQQRIVGGRRVTGLLPGTKRPLAWSLERPERGHVAHRPAAPYVGRRRAA